MYVNVYNNRQACTPFVLGDDKHVILNVENKEPERILSELALVAGVPAHMYVHNIIYNIK